MYPEISCSGSMHSTCDSKLLMHAVQFGQSLLSGVENHFELPLPNIFAHGLHLHRFHSAAVSLCIELHLLHSS